MSFETDLSSSFFDPLNVKVKQLKRDKSFVGVEGTVWVWVQLEIIPSHIRLKLCTETITVTQSVRTVT